MPRSSRSASSTLSTLIGPSRRSTAAETEIRVPTGVCGTTIEPTTTATTVR